MSNLNHENQNKKNRLGRGLGSLLGSTEIVNNSVPAQAPSINSATQLTDIAPPEARIWKMSVEKLKPSEFQPRNHFDKEALTELANSIKQNGILQPITVRKSAAGGFEIIAGERRWRAAQIAGLHEVPVIVHQMNDQTALELAIIENIQREDLNPIEEAEAYQKLMTDFGLTQQQVADKVGRERATVANALRLLVLPQIIRDYVIRKEISAGHAKVLLSLEDRNKQIALAELVKKQGLSVRKLEKLVAKNQTADVPEAGEVITSNVTQRLISGLSEELQKLLGTKVSIDYQNSKGKIAIHFYSDDELTQIIDKLKEGYTR